MEETVSHSDYIANSNERTHAVNHVPSGRFQGIATSLVDLGYPVHPLSAPAGNGRCKYRSDLIEKTVGKVPLTKNGHKDATTDPKLIARWAERWPDANVGINLELSGLVDVSSDSEEWLAKFQEWGLP